jgi:hypothetical protein
MSEWLYCLLLMFIVWFQLPVGLTGDFTHVRQLGLMGFGMLSFAWVYRVRFDVKAKAFLWIFAAIFSHSILFYSPGYTGAMISLLFGLFGILLLVSNLSHKQLLGVMATIALTVPVQYALAKYGLEWAGMTWAESRYKYLGGWGTFRHAVQYSFWTVGGTIIAFALGSMTKNAWLKVLAYSCAAVGCVGIHYAHSHAAIATLSVAASIVAVVRYGRTGSILPVALALYYAFSSNVDKSGFSLDTGRVEMWAGAWAQITSSFGSFLFGNGYMNWFVRVSSAHPHNEMLMVIYEFGILGAFAFLYAALIPVFFGRRNLWLCMGIVALATFSMSWSIRYPNHLLMVAVLYGMCLNTSEPKASTKEPRFGFRMRFPKIQLPEILGW